MQFSPQEDVTARKRFNSFGNDGHIIKTEKDVTENKASENQVSDNQVVKDCLVVKDGNYTTFTRPTDSEKENVEHKPEEKSIPVDQDQESPMLSCGKMVVNHIIDKLYFSDISVAARKVASESLGSFDEKSFIGKKQSPDYKSDSYFSNNSAATNFTLLKSDFNTDDEKTNESHPDSMRSFDEDNNNEFKNMSEAGFPFESHRSRKRQVSESSSKCNESTENEDGDELQPLRKSRRRNKGARYQKLINDGIIQPSKERIAAMNCDTPLKDDGWVD